MNLRADYLKVYGAIADRSKAHIAKAKVASNVRVLIGQQPSSSASLRVLIGWLRQTPQSTPTAARILSRPHTGSCPRQLLVRRLILQVILSYHPPTPYSTRVSSTPRDNVLSVGLVLLLRKAHTWPFVDPVFSTFLTICLGSTGVPTILCVTAGAREIWYLTTDGPSWRRPTGTYSTVHISSRRIRHAYLYSNCWLA
jgi:hypothetical protein